MRPDYQGGSLDGRPTVSGDTFTNTISSTATTTAIPGVPPGLEGVETDVADGSSWTLTTGEQSIDKKIRVRNAAVRLDPNSPPVDRCPDPIANDPDYIDADQPLVAARRRCARFPPRRPGLLPAQRRLRRRHPDPRADHHRFPPARVWSTSPDSMRRDRRSRCRVRILGAGEPCRATGVGGGNDRRWHSLRRARTQQRLPGRLRRRSRDRADRYPPDRHRQPHEDAHRELGRFRAVVPRCLQPRHHTRSADRLDQGRRAHRQPAAGPLRSQLRPGRPRGSSGLDRARPHRPSKSRSGRRLQRLLGARPRRDRHPAEPADLRGDPRRRSSATSEPTPRSASVSPSGTRTTRSRSIVAT